MLLIVFVCGLMVAPFASQAADRSEIGGDFVIKLKPGVGPDILGAVAKNIRQRFVGLGQGQFDNIYSFNSRWTAADLQNFLSGRFEYLQPERQLSQAGMSVNDPGFTPNAQDINRQWYLAKVGFNSAWAKTVGSYDNVVAVIDTGIDETHEDLKALRYLPGYSFVSRQSIQPGTNSDDNGHGTLVAGVLGAAANNNLGIAGTNWKISLMPIKALDGDGKGEATAVAEGIVWATDHGAGFINLSVGGIGFAHDTTLAAAVSYAFNRNLVIVAAAGNDLAQTGSNLDNEPVFPICDDNNLNMIIGVTATDQFDLKPDFANYGKNCIDVAAPGKRILSTINYDPISKKYSPNSYAYASGTSLAVPLVIGQAALIKTLYPSLNNAQIRDRIMATADSISELNLSQCGGGSCSGLLGTGRINVPKSLETQVANDAPKEGEVVKASDTGLVYQILGGQKRLISTFVYNQRFLNSLPRLVYPQQLAVFPDGPYVTPYEGSLIKWDGSPTVYQISQGLKLPVTYLVFQERGYKFADVVSVTFSEINSWPTGAFLPPMDGMLVKSANRSGVYWVVGGNLHLVSPRFYEQRGLKIFPILVVPAKDLPSYPKGETYNL